MSTTFRSFAKINLHLRVMGSRKDGYHELETVFQTVDLCDLIALELTDGGVDLRVIDGQAPGGEANLATQAALGFLSRWAPESGVRIDLQKRIPVGGGLGGGSSNAATVLLGLQSLLGVPEAREDLQDLAASLGADVPFFLYGGTAFGWGRGDRIEPLPDLPERAVWLVTPDLSISTAAIFGELNTATVEAVSSRRTRTWDGDLEWRDIEHGWNDLEEIVRTRFAVMSDVYNALVEVGACVVRLSGTGATLFAFFDGGAVPSGLAAVLPSECRVVETRTLTRSSLERLKVVR